MDKGWLELESDPGLFTLLLEDFGVQGVQVEEIYDLQKPIEGPVYGFIFLFKWIEERRSRRKIINEEESFVMDEEVVNNMFFAQQVIPNSCATHALVSVLMNCEDKLHLGETFAKLKEFSAGMNPEDKGFAIGNLPDLAAAHNSHARPEPRGKREKKEAVATVRKLDAFHFVSYVPLKGRLFELDGLKPYPIDHGPWGENEEWTEKFRRVISERLGMATGGEPYHDIRFNLMAVVPDRCHMYEQKLVTLKTNRQIVLEALQQGTFHETKISGNNSLGMVKVTSPELTGGPSTRSSRSTRSAARDALNLPITFETPRTRQKTRAAAAVHAAAVAAVQAAASNGEISTDSSTVKSEAKNGVGSDSLDVHSYAKLSIPIDGDGVKIDSGAECDDVMDESLGPQIGTENGNKVNINQLNGDQLKTIKDNAVKIEISVSDEQEGSVTMSTTVANTDVTKPLIINTKFSASPGPSSESTDTASEVGSAFNSPVCSTTTSAQSSPNTSLLNRTPPESHHTFTSPLLQMRQQNAPFKTELKCEMSNEEKLREIAVASGTPVPPGVNGKNNGEQVSPNTQARSKFSSQQGFTPKDLLALLKNVESEIASTETNLRDELDKRKKYRVDDCRRTHNYDQFICTFLSMLAEQGLLAGLVEHNMLIKRRSGSNNGSNGGSGGGIKSAISSRIRKPDKRKPKSKGKRKR